MPMTPKKYRTAFMLGLGKARKAFSENGCIKLQAAIDSISADELSEAEKVAKFEIEGWNSVFYEHYGNDEPEEHVPGRGFPFMRSFNHAFCDKTRLWLKSIGNEQIEKCEVWTASNFIFDRGFAIRPDALNCKSYWRAPKLPLACLMELRIAMGVDKHFGSLNSSETSLDVVADAVSLLKHNGYKVTAREIMNFEVKQCPIVMSSDLPKKDLGIEAKIQSVDKRDNVNKNRAAIANLLSSGDHSVRDICRILNLSNSEVRYNLLHINRSKTRLNVGNEWWISLKNIGLAKKLISLGYRSKSDCLVWGADDLNTFRSWVIEPGVTPTSAAEWENETRRLPQHEVNELRQWLGFAPLQLKYNAKIKPSKRNLELSIFIAANNGYEVIPCDNNIQ